MLSKTDYQAAKETFLKFKKDKFENSNIDKRTDEFLASHFDELDALLMCKHQVSAYDFFAATRQSQSNGCDRDEALFARWNSIYELVDGRVGRQGSDLAVLGGFDDKPEVLVYCSQSNLGDVEKQVSELFERAIKGNFQIVLVGEIENGKPEMRTIQVKV